jgi:two-component system, chemotaxis family, sensor kinase CheA
MGDGRVALILDVLGLARRGNVLSPTRERTLAEEPVSTPPAADLRERLLLFRARGSSRMAMPLSLVARLEEMAPERLERAGGRDVVQHRGAVLPLIWLDDATTRNRPRQEPLHVVVFCENGRSVGLVVDEILDVVEEVVHVEPHAPATGLLGLAVIQGRVTDLLDVRALLERDEPSFFAHKGAAA